MSQLPPKPPMPPPPVEPPKGRSFLGIFLACLLAMVVFGALLFLTQGAIGFVLIIAGSIFGLTALHYLVWGWWLEKLVRQAENVEGDSDEL